MPWANNPTRVPPIQCPFRWLRLGLVRARLLAVLLALVVAGCSGTITKTLTPTPHPSPTKLTLDEETAVLSNGVRGEPSATETSKPVIPATLTPSPPPLGEGERTEFAGVRADLLTATSIPPDGLRLLQVIEYPAWELVHASAWSADGAWLAISAGETVYLYDGSKLEPRAELRIGVWASGLAFAPLGLSSIPLLALAARDGSIQLWDASTGRRLAVFWGHKKGANSVSFSPDGLLLASTGNDALVRLWDLTGFWAGLSSGNMEGLEIPQQAAMIGGAFAVPAVRFSPDGQIVASVDLQAIRLRDPASTRLVRTLRGEASVFSIAFSPNGEFLAAAEMGSMLRVWQVDSGEVATAWQAGENPKTFLWSAAFSADGNRLAAVSSQGWVYLWSFPLGDALAAFQGHTRAASTVSFSPDGRWLVTGGLDAQVKLWELP